MNRKFRGYVTDVAFRLTLGKTHITALVAIKQAQVFKGKVNPDAEYPWMKETPQLVYDMGTWVGAIRQLEERGLVEHGSVPDGKEWAHLPFWRRYRITRAGELAWEMLVEAGMVEGIVTPRRASKVVAA